MVVGPDLGTAIVLALTAAVLFYVAGLERRYIIAAGRRRTTAADDIRSLEALPSRACNRPCRSGLQDH